MQQQQPPEDDWGLGELTDADIWGNLPKKAAVSVVVLCVLYTRYAANILYVLDAR